MNLALRNFLSLVVGRYVALAIGAVVTFLLARALGVVDYGHFIAALSASEIFGAFLDLGLTRILVKEGSADRERVGAHLHNILWIKGLLTVLVMVAVHVYAAREGVLSPYYQLILLLALCKVADNYGLSFDGVFQVFQRMEYSAVILVAGRVLLVACVMLGWRQGAGIVYFAWIYFMVSLATTLAAMLVSGLRFAPPRRGELTWKDTVGREGIFFALSTILSIAGTRMDVVALKEWAAPGVLGLYGAAARVMLVFQILPQVLQTSVLPDLFRLGRHDHPGLHRFYAAYMRRSLMLSLYPFLWAFCFPAAVVGGLFGRDFAAAAPWLRLLALLLPLRFMSMASGNVLTALDRQWERTIWTSLWVAGTVALLFTLVPTQGVRGCLVALLSGEVLLAVLCMSAAWRLGYRPSPGSILRPAAAIVVTGAALLLIDRAVHLGLFASLAAVCLLGALAQMLTGALRPHELRALLRIRGA